MFYLKNLVSTEIHRGLPWDFDGHDRIPANVFKDKSARTAWLQNPGTQFFCYSLFEGNNPALRLKGPSVADEGNAPVKCYGIAADYDLPLSDAEIDAGLARMPIKPRYHEVTLSGNTRLLWVFEEPVALPSYSFAIFFLKNICDFLPVKQLAGLDENALLSPDRYYTNGCKWKPIPTTPVSKDLLKGFLVGVSSKFGWDTPEFGPTVPMDVLIPELRKRHPKFTNWSGKFEVGAQGPSFWIENSKSPMSAIVRETGLQTFSGSAPKAWYSWSELVGAEFVNQFKAKQLGSAVADIYFDEKTYFSRLADGSWALDSKENLALYLKTHKGLSDRVRKGENASEIENAISFINRNHRVKTCASFCFYPEGVLDFNGTSVLNTHTRKALAPAQGPAPWGKDGPLPFLSHFIGTLFCPREQCEFFLAWFKYFYESCYYRKPRSGTALFLAGGVNTGKTLLSRAIISRLVGGFAEANDYLMGTDNFSQEMFDAAAWVVDDGSLSVDARSHKKFSEQVKRATANPHARCNGKFLKAVTVKWQGRVIITMNTDSESLRLLPDLSLSIREKVTLLRTVAEPAVQFLPQSQMDDMLQRELPFLARFLLDYSYPPHTLSKDPRFYVSSYAEDSLVTSANHSSSSSAFSEILEDFLSEYFTRFPEKDDWRGNSLLLHKQILAAPEYAQIMRPYTSQTIGRLLGGLIGKNIFEISGDGGEFSQIFRIGRGHRFPKKINGHTVPQAQNSVFQKI